MLRAKPCHAGLEAKSHLLGMEPLDLLMLFPVVFVSLVVLEELVAGVVLTALLGFAVRLTKWGRLSGYTLTLIRYLALPRHIPALGRDRAPRYPRTRRPR